MRLLNPLIMLPCFVLLVATLCATGTGAQGVLLPAVAIAPAVPGAVGSSNINGNGTTIIPATSSSGSLDGSHDLKVPLLSTVVPRLEQILAEVVANASSRSGNRSHGQDTERAAAAGFVVRRGTQFFKDGKPYYFVGGNAYWFVDLYTLDWGREKIEEFLDTCQKLGISVLRTWFFNLGMPKDFNRYDPREIAGMDYVIWAAKKRGLMLTLTMGNLWNAYRGPEDFLLWATGSLEGKDILSFYSDPAARKLYKLHIYGLLTRVNPLTGLAPKDDPTIFSFNIINEPRCPGCFTPEQQAVHQDFLRDIGAFMRALTPLHLISAGTEGFFVEDKQSMLHWYNPGPGAQCDGEDWFAISSLPYLDYATVHVYERHMELQPRPSLADPNWADWLFCDFECYVPWFRMYVQLHNYLATNVLKKPVVIEEFGLTWFKKTPAQQRVLFQVAMDMLVASAENNGALAGAMFWNAAHNDTVDWDGYNVKIDRPAYFQAGSALPGPTSLPPTVVSPEQAMAMTPDNRTRPVPRDVAFSIAGAPPALAAQMNVTQPPRRITPAVKVPPKPAAATPPIPAAAAAAGAATIGARTPLPGATTAAANSTAAVTAALAATAANATAVRQPVTQPPAAAAVTSTAGVTANTPPVQAAGGPAGTTATTAATAAQQPLSSSTLNALQAAVAATPRVTSTTPAPVGTAVGRRHLLGRIAPDTSSLDDCNQQQHRQTVVDNSQPPSSHTDAATVRSQQQHNSQLYKAVSSSSSAAAHPYQSVSQLQDIAEHLSGTELYLAAMGRPHSRSNSHHRSYHHSSLSSSSSATTWSSGSSSSSSSSSSRQLLEVVDELDAFRRGPMRQQCARASSATWRPYKLFNLTDDITTNPRYEALLQGGDVVAVISDATAKLNKISNDRQVQQPASAAAPTTEAQAPPVAPAAATAAPTATAAAAQAGDLAPSPAVSAPAPPQAQLLVQQQG